MVRTFHHRDFANLRRLLEAKTRLGFTVSACIPTLNEEATIGTVVGALKASPLLDEVLVIDSGSTDDTRAMALAAGAAFHAAADIAPETGPAAGKGENLWKSLRVARGDILLFVDGDLRNPHPRFVSGLIGPLLTDPDLHYIKAFYNRPGGGGRVTEILVRPMLERFFSALAALRQPLAGEYAARRWLLEALPFPTGYAVETTHLIDILRGWGADVLGQTDLGVRRHRCRPLADLGKMSAEILNHLWPRITGESPPSSERPPLRPPDTR